MAYFGNSDIKKAIYYFEQSVDLYKKVFGENDISVGNRMNNVIYINIILLFNYINFSFCS